MNMLLEGFYTKLSDPFVLSAPVESENGSLVQTRSNGSGQRCTVLRWRERLSGGIKYRYRQV